MLNTNYQENPYLLLINPPTQFYKMVEMMGGEKVINNLEAGSLILSPKNSKRLEKTLRASKVKRG